MMKINANRNRISAQNSFVPYVELKFMGFHPKGFFQAMALSSLKRIKVVVNSKLKLNEKIQIAIEKVKETFEVYGKDHELYNVFGEFLEARFFYSSFQSVKIRVDRITNSNFNRGKK